MMFIMFPSIMTTLLWTFNSEGMFVEPGQLSYMLPSLHAIVPQELIALLPGISTALISRTSRSCCWEIFQLMSAYFHCSRELFLESIETIYVFCSFSAFLPIVCFPCFFFPQCSSILGQRWENNVRSSRLELVGFSQLCSEVWELSLGLNKPVIKKRQDMTSIWWLYDVLL